MKEFAPKGSKFFPFRDDPFSEGSKTLLTELSTLKVDLFPLDLFEFRFVFNVHRS